MDEKQRVAMINIALLEIQAQFKGQLNGNADAAAGIGESAGWIC